MAASGSALFGRREARDHSRHYLQVDGGFRFSAAIPTPSFQDDHYLVYRQNGPGLRFRHAGVRGLIDTRFASPKRSLSRAAVKWTTWAVDDQRNGPS